MLIKSYSKEKKVRNRQHYYYLAERIKSVLEDSRIRDEQDLGFDRVQRKEDNELIDIVYDFTFAIFYHVFL